ncbi:hypothetical protein [Pedobacter sp.]|uniref:hypothetical protein n=1 Tax=Pedobacter sp. TaxID=1411316 RepID=UPI003D7FF1CD
MPQRKKGMAEQITRDTEALKLFFTEDIFLVPNEVLPAVKDQKASGDLIETNYGDTIEKQVEEISYVGRNAKHILILVNADEYPESISAGVPLLWNIVKAIKLDPNDVAVVNYAAYPNLHFDKLQSHFQPQLLISFGVPATALNLGNQPLQVLVNLENANAIFSLTLKGLDEDLNSKKLLWKSLQQLNLS